MNTLSIGLPSTLGSYHDLCSAIFGSDSAPAKYFADMIAKSPEGRDEEVITAESQMMFLIGELLRGQLDGTKEAA